MATATIEDVRARSGRMLSKAIKSGNGLAQKMINSARGRLNDLKSEAVGLTEFWLDYELNLVADELEDAAEQMSRKAAAA